VAGNGCRENHGGDQGHLACSERLFPRPSAMPDMRRSSDERARRVRNQSGLTVNDGGKEKISASGRTDILAVDANGENVVIELKAGTADREVIAKILSYMGDLQMETGNPVREIVIAHDFTSRAAQQTSSEC
jgi:hypothetical protein